LLQQRRRLRKPKHQIEILHRRAAGAFDQVVFGTDQEQAVLHDAGLQDRDWKSVRKYAASLEAYTSAEPLAWTDMLIKRARLLADAGEKGVSKQTRAGLEAVKVECQRMNARTAAAAVQAALSD
jgi:hypothetical protein